MSGPVAIQRMWRRHRPSPSTARVMVDVRARLLARIPEGAGTFVAVARDPAVLRAVGAALRRMSWVRSVGPRALLAAFALAFWPSPAPPALRDAAVQAVHAFIDIVAHGRRRSRRAALVGRLRAYEAALRVHA